MLKFFDALKSRNNFIEIDFDNISFQFLSKKGKILNQLIETFLQELKEKTLSQIESRDDENTVTYTYEKDDYIIFKNPIEFKLFYDDSNVVLKAYNESHLRNILKKLDIYYEFSIDKENTENDINNILSNKEIKEIILYPFFTELFYNLNFTVELSNKIKIKKELLEPLQIYIEKKEALKNLKNQNDFKEDLIDNELIFVFNEERKQFIDKLDQYAEKTLITEPMKIVGNDGVGKTLTLQFYSSIKLKGYNKFYFNLKLFELYGLKNYFFIELIRGFSSKENNLNGDFKDYANCVNHIQKLTDSKKNNFFDVLKELMKFLEFYDKKYIIILDQFKYEYITDTDFEIFKGQIEWQKFRLIICCSLNDGKIKNKMFKEYENEILWLKDDPHKEENISQIKEIKEIIIENFDENEKNKINLKNIYIFKKRREATESLNKDKDILNKNEKDNGTNEDINTFNNNDLINVEKTNNENKGDKKDKNKEVIVEPKYIYKLPIKLSSHKYKMADYDETPIKIYYNNLVDLKEIIEEKEPEEIYNFMSNFNCLPKYYKKFNTFKINQKLNNINDISLIIENFKEEISNKISQNINNFYNKEYDFDKINNNIYNFIFKLKKKINKYSDRNINFKKLYKFSKKFPMKYIIVKNENNLNIINFDKSIINGKFKLNYSFPFIEYVLNNIIESYDNDNKIDIKYLSGSAFGNALELKLRKYQILIIMDNTNRIKVIKLKL